MNSVELFAGAGGLAMGVAQAGFRHQAVIEWDRDACATINENKARLVSPVADWPVFPVDVCHFDLDYLRAPERRPNLIAGGPPCQPFSLGGKHRSHQDERDMFPQAIRYVRELQPQAFIFENVKGLTRQTFASYFQYIQLQLSYPEITRRANEEWMKHLEQLERHHTHGRVRGLTYRVVTRLLKAADYGVPQRRDRVFIVGFRSDLHREWNFPSPTHSQDALWYAQWVTGEYWDRHKVARRNRPPMPEKLRNRVERLKERSVMESPWLTVRDTISDLPNPQYDGGTAPPFNHRYIPGARTYPGHTGSPLDEPAKTLKAGDHGVPGGENMLAYADGSVRYFTVRESARLQTFPDDYVFHGSWGETMRQLGNAVPVKLAQSVAGSVWRLLHEVGAEKMRDNDENRNSLQSAR